MSNARLHERLIEMAAMKGMDPRAVRQAVIARPDAWTPEMLAAQLEGRWGGWGLLSQPRRRFLDQVGLTVLGRGFAAGWGASGDEAPAPGVDAVLEECAGRHAHVASVTIAMIHAMKTAGGIVPSTDFAWTMREDPHAWRMVNGYGRPRHVHEVVASFAHWEAERAVGKAIPDPDFTELAREMSRVP